MQVSARNFHQMSPADTSLSLSMYFLPCKMGDDMALADGGACELAFTPLMSNAW